MYLYNTFNKYSTQIIRTKVIYYKATRRKIKISFLPYIKNIYVYHYSTVKKKKEKFLIFSKS